MILDVNTCKAFYQSYILPHFDYCSSVWGTCPQSLMVRLSKLQKTAARLILNRKTMTPTGPLLEELHWMPISERIKLRQLCLVFKALNENSPPYLQKMFVKNSERKNCRFLRSSNNNILYVERFQTNYCQCSFRITGSKAWNMLPNNVRNSPSLDAFRSRYLKYYFSECSVV